MANYVLLYSGGKMPESEAEQAAVLQGWDAWYGKLAGAVVDRGLPFTPQAKSISSNGVVSEGPIGTMATGYSVIQANSLDEAVALAKECPVLEGGGEISVYETFDMG